MNLKNEFQDQGARYHWAPLVEICWDQDTFQGTKQGNEKSCEQRI